MTARCTTSPATLLRLLTKCSPHCSTGALHHFSVALRLDARRWCLARAPRGQLAPSPRLTRARAAAKIPQRLRTRPPRPLLPDGPTFAQPSTPLRPRASQPRAPLEPQRGPRGARPRERGARRRRPLRRACAAVGQGEAPPSPRPWPSPAAAPSGATRAPFRGARHPLPETLQDTPLVETLPRALPRPSSHQLPDTPHLTDPSKGAFAPRRRARAPRQPCRRPARLRGGPGGGPEIVPRSCRDRAEIWQGSGRDLAS